MKENQYTDEELLAYLKVYTDIWGVPPRTDDVNQLPGPTAPTYIQRFGSWEQALGAAGVLPEEGET